MGSGRAVGEPTVAEADAGEKAGDGENTPRLRRNALVSPRKSKSPPYLANQYSGLDGVNGGAASAEPEGTASDAPSHTASGAGAAPTPARAPAARVDPVGLRAGATGDTRVG